MASRPGPRDQARESARARRATEAELFKELEVLLGLARYDGDSRRDKATVVRLATTFLKAQQVLRALCQNKEAKEAFAVTQAKPEGALVVVTEDMEVLAVSDGVADLLGLGVVEVMGSQLTDMVHPCDHSLLRELFQPGCDIRQVVVRARCAARGKARPAGYMVVRLRGRMRRSLGRDGQVFIGELQSLEQEDGEVWSRHGRDLKISETSPGFQAATGYQAAWLEGRSYWSLVHPADVQGLRGAVTRLQDLGETETPTYRLLCRGGGSTLLVSQLRLRGDSIHCRHNCLLQTREEERVVEAVEQIVEDSRVMAREEDLFSLIDSKSFTSSGDEGGSPYCVLVEEEVEVVEASQVLTISEEEEEESSTIFSPHFSDPLLCSINPSSSTIVSVRRHDETRLVLEASGDFLLEEDAPVTILEEVQAAEMEEVQATELEVLEIDSIQPLRTEQVSFDGCDIESGKLVNQTTTILPSNSRKSDLRCSLPYYTGREPESGPGEKSSVLKYLLQDPEFGKSRGRIKVA